MTPNEVIEEFRNQVVDTALPYLWSDSEVFGYLVDAQDTFARNTGGIPDVSTPAIVKVQAVADQPLAKLSPYILRVRTAHMEVSGIELSVANVQDLANLRVLDYGTYRPVTLRDTDTGPVIAAILGVERNKVRWFRVPTADDVCSLNVYRLPYPRLVKTGAVELEIDDQHHRSLILWMKHLAYGKHDAETYDKDASEKCKLDFEKYCAKAKTEIERKRFKPRVVQYGGL